MIPTHETMQLRKCPLLADSRPFLCTYFYFPPSMIPNGHTCLNHQIKNRETIRSPGHYNPPQKLVYTDGTNVRFGSEAVLRLNSNCSVRKIKVGAQKRSAIGQ